MESVSVQKEEVQANKESVTIITHGDCDGICSAAIALKRYNNANVVFAQPFMVNNVLKNEQPIRSSDKIILLDLALTDKTVDILVRLFTTTDIIIIDHHHQSTKYTGLFDGIINPTMSTSQLAAIYFGMPTILAEIGAVGDRMLIVNKNSKLFIEAELIRESLSYDPDDDDFRLMLCNNLANDVMPSAIHEVVRRANESKKQIDELIELCKQRIKHNNKFVFIDATDLNIKGKVSAIAGTLASSYKKPVFILFTRDNRYILTGRNYGHNDVDLHKVMKRFGGGGHKNASSALIRDPNNLLEKLKEAMQ